MLLGVNVPNFGPGTEPEVLRRWALTVEGLGFDMLMLSDHLVVTADVAEHYPKPFFEPLTTLAWIAGLTTRLRLGTTVLIVPHRHPLVVARMAANLHQLSARGLVLGVGTGWAQQEFTALGADFTRRGADTDAYLAAMTAAWADEDDYGPARNIPLWVGGNSAVGMRRAVRLGDAWHPLRFTSAWVRSALPQLRAFADEQGRSTPAFAPRIVLHLTESPMTGEDRLMGEGTIGQILGDLEELASLGAETVTLDPYVHDPDETRHPEIAWRALETVAAHWADRI